MNCFSVEYELQVMTEKLYKAFTSKISDHAVAIGIWTLKTGVKCTKITFSNEKFQKNSEEAQPPLQIIHPPLKGHHSPGPTPSRLEPLPRPLTETSGSAPVNFNHILLLSVTNKVNSGIPTPICLFTMHLWWFYDEGKWSYLPELCTAPCWKPYEFLRMREITCHIVIWPTTSCFTDWSKRRHVTLRRRSSWHVIEYL